MGKKIRCQYLTGNLLEPFFQFTNKLEFGINPISDPRGTRIAQHIYRYAMQTKPKFKGQKFQSIINYDFTSNHSWVIFNYLNGYRQGYLLKHINMQQFEMQHKFTNLAVQSNRILQGHEDQYEEEERK